MAQLTEREDTPTLVPPSGEGGPLARVVELSSDRESAWDEYVVRDPRASPFHLLGWKRVVERSFGKRAIYLLAVRGPSVVGVLPMFLQRGLLSGRALVSLPYAIRGGVIADDQQTADLLLTEARRIGAELGVDGITLRSELRVFGELPEIGQYVTFRADLTLSESESLARMERKRRQMINYVRKTDYRGRTAGLEEVELFYDLFCQSMRSHGTPVYPRRFLEEILGQYGERANLYFVSHEGRTVAGVLNLLFRDTILPFYAGTDRENRPRGLDDFLYWSLMCWARDTGYRTFDFGRSRKGTGAHGFKARWGMEEVPLHYQYAAGRIDQPRDMTPDNPRLRFLINAWRRLPLWATRLVGPRIIRGIP